jgi:hypothetical protein
VGVVDRAAYAAALGRTPATRHEFVAAVRAAVAQAAPLAVAKVGNNEGNLLLYARLPTDGPARTARRAFERHLLRTLPVSGLFPLEPDYIRDFAAHFGRALAWVDWVGVGLHGAPDTAQILHTYPTSGRVMDYLDQEPERMMPTCEACCWLPALQDKRVLLVNSLADFLAARANRGCFEAVWANTGKRWFAPRQVDALEFPYGFLAQTQATYGTLDRLLEAVIADMGQHDYDVALIGAGAMSLPLAVAAKQQGKVGIALGGHLQVLFGVLGNRWRNAPDYQPYFNAAWTDVPADLVPVNTHLYENSAYW